MNRFFFRENSIETNDGKEREQNNNLLQNFGTESDGISR